MLQKMDKLTRKADAAAAAKKRNQAVVYEPFGDGLPFCDPAWYQGFATPYYHKGHVEFRAKVRDFVERELKPYVSQWEEEEGFPRDLPAKAYKAGIFGVLWPERYGGTPVEGGFDYFYDLIYWDELARCGAGGVTGGCFLPPLIALSPVLAAGSDYLKDRVAPEVIRGEAMISLAVTEPYAGSDVAGIRATAQRDGDFYVVNGQKKFITAGTFAKYFTTAVRTGSDGHGGISLLLIEADSPGITIRRLPTQGWASSGTAHIVFEDVRVPVSHLIGKEHQGFRAIMVNFNHERFAGTVMSTRAARLCIEEAIRYSQVRKVFGKRLAQADTIRMKFADCLRQIEATQSQLETIAYQLSNNVNPQVIAGPIALLKVQSTKVLELCAREASQVFGGNAFLKTGPGAVVERTYREVRVAAIGGGSEEVMSLFAIRNAKL